MGASTKMMGGAAAAHRCVYSFSSLAAAKPTTVHQGGIGNASGFTVGKVSSKSAAGGICSRSNDNHGRVNNGGDELCSMAKLSMSEVKS